MKCDLTTIATIFPGFFLQWISHCMFVEAVLSGRNLASHSCQWCELTKWQKLSLLEASTWKITETEHTVKQSGLDCDCRGKWISDKKEKDFEIAVTVALMDDQVHRIGYAIKLGGGRLQIWNSSLNLTLSCVTLFDEEMHARLNSAGFIKRVTGHRNHGNYGMIADKMCWHQNEIETRERCL